MEAKEIMIGDWVQFADGNKKYTVVGVKCDARYLEDEAIITVMDRSGHWFDKEMDYLEPILITAEILKANGFIPDDLCDWAERYVCPAEIKKIPQTILEFTFYEGISADTLFKCWTKPESRDGENSVHICDLKYVHQLQHALRLCGIEKEIKLED